MNILSKIRRSDPRDCPGSAAEKSGTDVWNRWHLGSLYAFYILLAVVTIAAQVAGGMTVRERAITLGLTLLVCAWHYFMMFRRSSGEIYRNNSAVLVYFVVVLALFAPLIWINPNYNFLSFVFFWQNFSLWSMWWAVPGSAVGSLYMTLVNTDMDDPLSGIDWSVFSGILSISLVVSIALGLFITSIIRQSSERRRLIEELESTRAELAAEERRAGVIAERGRLAKEIHDTLAQGFISIVTHLEAAEESDPDEANRHIEQAKRTSRENLVEARRLVAALRPEILEGSSLPEALSRLSGAWSGASGVPARFEVTGEELILSQNMQVALLRAAQEALSNIRRHAEASEVNLTLSYAEDLVLLDVQDDGRGFDPGGCEHAADGEEGGFGLRAMRERVESLGGELSIESAEYIGTTIALRLPLVEKKTTVTQETRR